MLASTSVLRETSVLDELSEHGFVVIQTEANEPALFDVADRIGQIIRADTFGATVVEGSHADSRMLIHNESITQTETDFLRTFALGALEVATTGGQTLVYDGRVGAKRVLEDLPELANLSIEYVSTVYDGQSAVHPLVYAHPEHGPVMRYRGQAPTNIIQGELPAGMTEQQFYEEVDALLSDTSPVAHNWQAGDVVVINNENTLHSRQPYDGARRLVRYRFDDPHYPTYKVGQRAVDAR